jgi:hypothetical protein
MNQSCNICLAQHDEEIHAATNRVHGWFRTEVTKSLHGAVDDPMLSEALQVQIPPSLPPIAFSEQAPSLCG